MPRKDLLADELEEIVRMVATIRTTAILSFYVLIAIFIGYIIYLANH